MPPRRFALEMAVLLWVSSVAIRRDFERETGMTLDEWDEMNYARIMAAD